MNQPSAPFNRPTAEILANHIADSALEDVRVTDIVVVGTARGHVIQMEYQLNGEVHHRVLRSVAEVTKFLHTPADFTINSSPETVSWAHEMDF